MGSRGTGKVIIGEGARLTGRTPRGCPEAKTSFRPPTFGLSMERMSWGGSWTLAVFCLWGTHRNAGMWVIFSPLTTPTPAQEECLVDRDPHPDSTSDGQVCQMTEGQNRPKVTVAIKGPGEPRPMNCWKRTPPLKPTRLHWQLKISSSNLEHSAHIKHMGPDDLEPN